MWGTRVRLYSNGLWPIHVLLTSTLNIPTSEITKHPFNCCRNGNPTIVCAAYTRQDVIMDLACVHAAWGVPLGPGWPPAGFVHVATSQSANINCQRVCRTALRRSTTAFISGAPASFFSDLKGKELEINGRSFRMIKHRPNTHYVCF